MQTQTERVFLRQDPAGHLFQYSKLFNPQRLLADENGFVVFDYGGDKAVRFNWDFRLLNEISLESGQGPGEMGGITDTEIVADTLYLADASNAVIHVYGLDGNFGHSFSIADKIPHRIVSIGSEHLFISTPMSPVDGMEGIYSYNGNAEYSVESITADDVRYRVLLESEFASNSEFVFRAPQFFGVLIKYDRTGAVVSARKTIDGFYTTFDDRDTGGSNQPLMFNRSDLEMATLRIRSAGDAVCTLQIRQVGDPEGERVTDCYDAETLEYRFSLDTPAGTQDIGLYDNYFVTVQDTTLTVNRIHRD
ncbi:MAG: hypothetical protein WD315_02480 [Balneolaceae bacterium]